MWIYFLDFKRSKTEHWWSTSKSICSFLSSLEHQMWSFPDFIHQKGRFTPFFFLLLGLQVCKNQALFLQRNTEANNLYGHTGNQQQSPRQCPQDLTPCTVHQPTSPIWTTISFLCSFLNSESTRCSQVHLYCNAYLSLLEVLKLMNPSPKPDRVLFSSLLLWYLHIHFTFAPTSVQPFSSNYSPSSVGWNSQQVWKI